MLRPSSVFLPHVHCTKPVILYIQRAIKVNYMYAALLLQHGHALEIFFANILTSGLVLHPILNSHVSQLTYPQSYVLVIE